MTYMLQPVEAPATAVEQDPKRSLISRALARFTHFRRTRPFWGAILLAWSAYMIGNPLFGSSFAFYANVGARSMGPLLIAIGMLAAAGVAMVLPSQRHFPSVIATALAVAALPLANLGGLVIGTIIGIVGAGLIFAWTPYSEKQLATFAAREARRAERKAAKRSPRSGGAQPA